MDCLLLAFFFYPSHSFTVTQYCSFLSLSFFPSCFSYFLSLSISSLSWWLSLFLSLSLLWLIVITSDSIGRKKMINKTFTPRRHPRLSTHSNTHTHTHKYRTHTQWSRTREDAATWSVRVGSDWCLAVRELIICDTCPLQSDCHPKSLDYQALWFERWL